MSRSYRKPITKDSNPWAKKAANRRVRRTPEIADGKAYRRVFNPYDVSDYRFADWSPPISARVSHCLGYTFLYSLDEQRAEYEKKKRK